MDTYLILLSGRGKNGSVLAENDDIHWPDNHNSRITRTLAAGAYTVEATTYGSRLNGNFMLKTRAAGAPTATHTPTPTITPTATPALTATPEPPTGLTSTKGDGQITLEWQAPTNSQGLVYEIRERSRAASQSWTNWISHNADNLVSVTRYVVTGLISGTTYQHEVKSWRGT